MPCLCRHNLGQLSQQSWHVSLSKSPNLGYFTYLDVFNKIKSMMALSYKCGICHGNTPKRKPKHWSPANTQPLLHHFENWTVVTTHTHTHTPETKHGCTSSNTVLFKRPTHTNTGAVTVSAWYECCLTLTTGSTHDAKHCNPFKNRGASQPPTWVPACGSCGNRAKVVGLFGRYLSMTAQVEHPRKGGHSPYSSFSTSSFYWASAAAP